jgi:hypothetical protein
MTPYTLGYNDYLNGNESLYYVLYIAEHYDAARDYRAGWQDATFEKFASPKLNDNIDPRD